MSYFLFYFVSCYLLILPAPLCSLLRSCAPPQSDPPPSHTCLQLASLALPYSQCLPSTCTSASCWYSVYLSCVVPLTSLLVHLASSLYSRARSLLLVCSLCSWLVPPVLFGLSSFFNFFFPLIFSFPGPLLSFYCLHICSLKLTFCFQPAYLCVSAFNPHHFAFVGIT